MKELHVRESVAKILYPFADELAGYARTHPDVPAAAVVGAMATYGSEALENLLEELDLADDFHTEDIL